MIRPKHRVLVLSLALVIAAAGCGGGGNDDQASDKPATNKPAKAFEIFPDSSDPPTDASDLTWIREILSDVQGDYGLGYPGPVCAELTPAGVRELETARGGVPGDCAATIEVLQRRNRARGVKPRYSKVLSVKVHGRIGMALVVDPNEPDKAPYRVPFLNQGVRGWALPSLTYAEPIGDILHTPAD